MIKFCKSSYPEFSNFHPCKVTYNGVTYQSSEVAWQAQKILNKDIQRRFTGYTASMSKREGRRVHLRSDWEEVKYPLMVEVCYAKFSQNEGLKNLLLSTGKEELIEDTTAWHDNIWGNCECPRCINKPGQNLLGKALMEVRSLLASGAEPSRTLK